MAFDYSKLANMSLRQINDKGRNVTLRYVDAGQYDPVNDTVSGASNCDVSIKAVFKDFEQKELSNTIIERGDKQVLIPASGVKKPSLNDSIIDDGTLEIVNVMEVKTGDTPLIYKLQVRK